MRAATPALLLAVLLGLAGCRGSTEPDPSARRALPTTPAREPESCVPCHEAVVTRFASSAHHLAARRFEGEPQALRADAPVAASARPVMGLRPAGEGGAELLVATPEGGSEVRPITHVLGGIRRLDFLSRLGDREHVLPVSWSVTRGEWMNPVAEELGGPLAPESPLTWTSERRAHEATCARCHALPEPDEASSMTCSSCHGDAAAHVARHSGHADATTWARDGLRRHPADPWKGCASCHAVASPRPKATGLPESAPFTDRFLPVTFAGSGGIDRNMRLDGTPSVAHGMEAQSLATSPCFVTGGATCATCHDPHGGPGASLRDPDPDASCRSCHAAIAAEGAAHAGHPVLATPVPFARDEPGGPRADRLPGCVDCHAPALLPFGIGDLARDHAIGVPSPVADAAAGIVNGCMGCHADQTPEALQRALPPGDAPAAGRTRQQRLAAFRAALGASEDADTARAAELLAGVVGDARQDPWSRASAAHLLTGLGRPAAAALPQLEAAWKTASDPMLALAAINAHARLGGPLPEIKERLSQETDWRVALSIGAALAARGEQLGLETVEAIYGDVRLPEIARADAGSELAVLLIQQGSCRRAASVLTDALGKNPDSVPAWLNMGVARACLGDGPGARIAFERVLQMQPDHAMARRNLASLDESQR